MSKTFNVTVSRDINASASALYAIVSDYKEGHPSILPKPYFTELTVEKGGIGAGTIIRAKMLVMGREFAFRQLITEPEPGRVLVEANDDGGAVTRFIFEPISATQTRVTIATDFAQNAGLAGWLQRLTQPSITRKIYAQELQNLENIAAARATAVMPAVS